MRKARYDDKRIEETCDEENKIHGNNLFLSLTKYPSALYPRCRYG